MVWGLDRLDVSQGKVCVKRLAATARWKMVGGTRLPALPEMMKMKVPLAAIAAGAAASTAGGRYRNSSSSSRTWGHRACDATGGRNACLGSLV